MIDRRKFLAGMVATPLIIPAARLELTNTLIRRPLPPRVIFITPKGRIHWQTLSNSAALKPGDRVELSCEYYRDFTELRNTT